MEERFSIIKRGAIPSIREIEKDGATQVLGEFRDFRWSDALRAFMPDLSEFSVSFAGLAHGEVLKAHLHPIQSMMVVYKGSGEVFGDLCQPLREGDVLVVPAGQSHGFVGGPEGLHAVTIQLGQGFYTVPGKPRITFVDPEKSLKALLAYNAERLERFSQGELFRLLGSGALDDARKRRAYLADLRVWQNGVATAELSRAATCREESYRADDAEVRSAATSRSEDRARDSILQAMVNWFDYQMFVLDDAEKLALASLVIAPADSLLRRATATALARSAGQRRSEQVGAADEPNESSPLRRESPRTYARLKRVVGEAWDMCDALTSRLADLTRVA